MIMKNGPLYALSPLDGRYNQKTDSLKAIFSEFALIKHRVFIEIKWLAHLKPEIGNKFDTIFSSFSQTDAESVKALEQSINHDVKAVEYFVKQKIKDPQLSEWVHWGCTSNDINNLAYALMIQKGRNDVILPHIENVITVLKNYAYDYAKAPMLAYTHGQKATPTTMGKEFANVIARLSSQYDCLKNIRIYGKVNGAVGNFNAHHAVFPDKNWPEISKTFVENLGLCYQAYTTQIEPHDYIAEFAHNLIRINTILIGFCRDIWGYIAFDYLHQRTVTQEVGSSTMPHKVNPIDFENAEGNLYLANSLLQCLADKLPISRFQRDLVDSTLMRNIGTSVGYAVVAYQAILKGMSKIEINAAKMQADLNNAWEILAEPIQMAMRAYGIDHAYEKLKTLTRGKKINQSALVEFIQPLNLPADIKDKLLKLRPQDYTGYAEKLARNI